MATHPEKTVFISYRRDVSAFVARLIFKDLLANGYDVFMDVESIDSGTFDTIILNQIAARAHFIVILTPGSVERCAEPEDWLRREIETAMDLERNIVPILVNDFQFEDSGQYLTGKLGQLSRYNALNVPHDYFDEAMERLRTRFLKQPVLGAIRPTPTHEEAEVAQKVSQIAGQPSPTVEQLTAEQYFERGMTKYHARQFSEAIVEWDKAIRLNPQLDTAFHQRGNARSQIGDLEGAISDYDQAISLNPGKPQAYLNRALVYQAQGDFSSALHDCNTYLGLGGIHPMAKDLQADLRVQLKRRR